ncbi:MAG TPA: farnesyl diphosphate synthase [Gemmatimonadaceae bacterium]|nr:farnesyl diphosphate synthase [Gemmatimonadaceae bacterium]
MPDLVALSLAVDRRAIDDVLAEFCATELGGIEQRVADAIAYSLLGGGKRLRAMLVAAAYDAVGGAGDCRVLAAAVEIVHAYSLVHDDLPCMDDDDVRRGRPTVHRAFGVAVAACAGLAMVPLAARCAYRGGLLLGLPQAGAATIVRELMGAAGAGGMIGGQLLDLEAEGVALPLDELERVHRAKTGALIATAARVGALGAGAAPRQLAALDRYGAAIGLAFQIMDDVLDVTSTTDELGKTAGRDAALQKSTYPALLGTDGATQRAVALVDDATTALREAGILTPSLESIARYVVARRS